MARRRINLEQLASLLALGIFAFAVLSFAPPNHNFTGTITDSMCPEGDHSKLRRGPSDAECTVACVRIYGASYILYDGKNSYLLSDLNTPEEFAMKKVRIIGTLDTKTKTIQVRQIMDKNIDSLAVAYLAVIAIFLLYLFSVARR